MKSSQIFKLSKRLLALGAVAFGLIQTTAFGTTPGVIDSAFNASNGHWYYLLANSDWTDAETAAVGLGGHLATINDLTENNFVWNLWGTNRDLWIGLNDPVIGDGTGAQHAADFQWSSGDTSAYRNWRAGEPNNSNTGEYYAYIYAKGLVSGGGVWNDGPNVTQNPGEPLLFGVVEVPEPTTGLLLGGGMLVAILAKRRSRSRSKSNKSSKV
jgi:hypothetical protein